MSILQWVKTYKCDLCSYTETYPEPYQHVNWIEFPHVTLYYFEGYTQHQKPGYRIDICPKCAQLTYNALMKAVEKYLIELLKIDIAKIHSVQVKHF